PAEAAAPVLVSHLTLFRPGPQDPAGAAPTGRLARERRDGMVRDRVEGPSRPRARARWALLTARYLEVGGWSDRGGVSAGPGCRRVRGAFARVGGHRGTGGGGRYRSALGGVGGR